jgi:molecular chaperone GrpE
MADKPNSEPDGGSPDPAGPSNDETVSFDASSALQRERNDYYDRWLRTGAEFDNYRKRVERERREQADHAITSLLEDLLLVVDDFDRALTNAPAHDAADSGLAYRKGIELIHAKLHDLLRKRDVRPFDSLGADFDPKFHQAVVHEVSADHREGEVMDELRRGYMIGERLLRPAMVKVAKA